MLTLGRRSFAVESFSPPPPFPTMIPANVAWRFAPGNQIAYQSDPRERVATCTKWTVFRPPRYPKRYLPMKRLGEITTVATAVVCLAALAISIYPGWLNDLLFLAVLLGVFVVPVVLVALAVFVFIQYRRGNDQFPWKYVTITLLILFTTYAALRFYIPRRIAFAACRTSFQKLVDGGVVDDRELNRRIGPYIVDECLIDDRGGTYFRVYSGADGIGPDVMSYGFCYTPNRDGSPFGAAHYRTFRLGNGWHWFRASDDWF